MFTQENLQQLSYAQLLEIAEMYEALKVISVKSHQIWAEIIKRDRVEATPAPALEQIPIGEQLQIWSDSMPVWDRFPEEGRSAAYVLGHSAVLCNPEEQPRGVIVIFNARRGTIRAYPHTECNYGRICALPIFNQYGRAHHSELSPNRAFVESAPGGVLIPTNDCILWVGNGAIVCNAGIWGYISQGEHSTEYTRIELDWANTTGDRLRSNHLSTHVWGCAMQFYPSPEELVTEEHSAPCSSVELDTMMVTAPAPMFVTPMALLWQPTLTQTDELFEQLVYWQTQRADYELVGDGDGEEFCSLYVVGLMAIVANL